MLVKTPLQAFSVKQFALEKSNRITPAKTPSWPGSPTNSLGETLRQVSAGLSGEGPTPGKEDGSLSHRAGSLRGGSLDPEPGVQQYSLFLPRCAQNPARLSPRPARQADRAASGLPDRSESEPLARCRARCLRLCARFAGGPWAITTWRQPWATYTQKPAGSPARCKITISEPTDRHHLSVNRHHLSVYTGRHEDQITPRRRRYKVPAPQIPGARPTGEVSKGTARPGKSRN